jgi:hypothetical protein
LFSIADAFGKKRPSKLVKPWQSELFWRWEWLVSLFTGRKQRLTKHSAKSLHSKTEYSSEKVQKALHYNFQAVENVVQETSKDYLLLF